MMQYKQGGIIMDFNIRQATAKDYYEISNLVSEVFNLHLKNRPDVYSEVDNPFQRERFEELLNDDNSKLFVVEDVDSGELVAYSIVQIMTSRNISILKPSKFAYIDDFCVKSTYRNNGIGKVLFNYTVDYAKKEGASSLQLIVWEFNESAIKFYEALGMSTRNRRMELDLCL